MTPELGRTILAGISEAESGETVDLDDFTRYADDDGEEWAYEGPRPIP